MTRLSGSLLVLALLLPSAAHAQAPLAPTDVPAPLQPWIPWALDGAETYGCTFMPDGAPRCVWPGELALSVEPTGASFVLSVSLDHAGAVQLPGDDRRWPLDVRAGGRAIPVRRSGSTAWVDLPAGAHRIEGRFTWSAPPETIAIPPSTGRITLRTPAGPVARPRRDTSTLWLQTATREAAQEDTLSVEVFRRIDDGSPIRITTRIALRVGGRPREIALGRALLEGVDPIAVTSNAPVRMSEDGELTVQVQAGSFDVEAVGVRASLDAPLRAIPRAEIWPAEEIWVWSADEALRQVELSGADRIDPDRTNLPREWRGLPTYLAPSASAALTITTTRRGNPTPPPNQITLSRELWLDPDGEGLTGIDHLRGQMHQRWRLELVHGVLGRATVDDAPHLISTQTGEDGVEHAGVELRRPTIDVRADWRDESSSTTFAAVGWDEDVQHLDARLHLAPGFRLIAASGVDHAATWLDRWNLWGLFFVLVISLALGRLAGPVPGVVALVVLVLSYHAEDAPFLVWIPLVITLALAKALPRGWMRESMRYAFLVSYALLCLLVVYFAGYELRRGLWPYADPHTSSPSGWATRADDAEEELYIAEESAPVFAPAAPATVSSDSSGSGGSRRWAVIGGSDVDEPSSGYGSRGDASSRSANLWSYEPNAVLQTGPGVPTWQSRGGQTIRLGWDGPVTHDTEVRLWLITPLETAALAIVEVALFAIFLLFLFRARPLPPAPPAEHAAAPPATATPAAAAAATALSLLLAPSSVAHAQDAYEPSPQMLETLRTRLLRAPRCTPNCADLASATITVAGGRLVIDLDVQASALSAVPLPGPLDAWSPATITIDGGATSAAARADDGYLYARVPEGAHRVRLEGALPSTDAFTLAFAAAPHHASISAPGWEVDGLSGGDRIGSSIQLRRSVGTEPGEGDGESGGGASIRVVPWLSLERTFELGIRWEMTTTVRRTSAIGAPIVARIPLLPGESVLSSDLTVEDGVVVVTLGGTETQRSWSSVLTPRASLALTAPENERRSETWRVSCGTVWRCTTRDLDPVSIEQDGMWQPLFRPFPGDTLHVDVTRLPAAEGQSMTIDGARLTLRPGERLTIATLTLDVRSSVGSTQTITLPEGAVLQSVLVGGEDRSVEQRDRQVSLTVAPGRTEVQLEWQEPRALGVLYRSSPVTLSGGAVNATVVIERPSRWTLWLSGPAWGPVVLFWPYLLVLLVVSIALGRVLAPRDGSRPGVTTLDWGLLGLGLSLLPWQLAWIVPSWVALIEWRRRTPAMTAWMSDLRQLVILGWTLVTAVVLYAVIHIGLLVDPDTSIAPDPHSLEWYVDRIDGPEASMPIATLISAPTWAYHVVMLLWSLWLAARLIAWSRWAFTAFVAGGIWRTWPKKPEPQPAPAQTQAPPQEQAPQDPGTPDGEPQG